MVSSIYGTCITATTHIHIPPTNLRIKQSAYSKMELESSSASAVPADSSQQLCSASAAKSEAQKHCGESVQ